MFGLHRTREINFGGQSGPRGWGGVRGGFECKSVTRVLRARGIFSLHPGNVYGNDKNIKKIITLISSWTSEMDPHRSV